MSEKFILCMPSFIKTSDTEITRISEPDILCDFSYFIGTKCVILRCLIIALVINVLNRLKQWLLLLS